MSSLTHSIREQRLELEVDSESLALALQPRLGDVNRRSFLPIIERVLDEFAVPGRHIKIGRLNVDLGSIPFASFEEVAAERLSRELRRMLEEILHNLDQNLTPENWSQPEETSRLELLEHYLQSGMLPFWASQAKAFSLEALVLEMAEDDPQGLSTVIMRHGHQTRVLERLLLQLGEAALQRLLHVLEPEHAALIIVYMSDLRIIHRAEPVLALSERRFAQLLWLLVLSYTAQDPGTQFNRKSFLKSLLEGMAESEGLSYTEILKMLRLGLQETGESLSLQSPLPTFLKELMQEMDIESAGREAMLDLASLPTRRPAKPEDESTAARFKTPEEETKAGAERDELTTTASQGEPATDRTLPEKPALEEVAVALALLESYLNAGRLPAEDEASWRGGPDLRSLLRWLTTHDASRARRLIREIARRAEPGLEVVLARLLQAFPPEDVLSALAHEPQALMTSFVKVLSSVRASAVAGGQAGEVIPDDVVWASVLEYLLREATGRTDFRALFRGVLEAVALRTGEPVVSLAERLERGLRQASGVDVSELRKLQESARQFLLERARPVWEAGRSFARYDQVEVLRYYLHYGMLPWWALLLNPGMTIESVIKSLPFLSRALLRVVFSGTGPDERLRALAQAVRLLPEESLGELLRRLFHQAKGAETSFWPALTTFAAEAQDKQAFYARLIEANLDGRPVDLEELSSSAFAQTGGTARARQLELNEWEAHVLISALAHRLGFVDASSEAEHTAAALLQALLTTYPEETRNYFYAVRDRPHTLAALVQQARSRVFDDLLAVLHPGGADTLKALMRSFEEIPTPHRQSSVESLRRAILYEALRMEGKPLTAPFFVRVLRQLFGTSLPVPVARFLLQEAAAWSASDHLPGEFVSAFEVAVKSAEARTGGAVSLEEPATDEVRTVARGRVTPALREAVFSFLVGERQPADSSVEFTPGTDSTRQGAISGEALLPALLLMLDESPELVHTFIQEHQSDPRERERWIKILPENVLIRLSYLIEPQKHRILLDSAEVLASAWLETLPSGSQTLTERELYWKFLFEFLARNTEANRSTDRLVTAFFEYFAARYQELMPSDTGRARVGASLLEQARRLASEAGHSSLLALLHKERSQLLSAWEPSASTTRAAATDAGTETEPPAREGQRPPRTPPRVKMAFSMEDDEEDDAITETLYINNAGLALTGPFLPHLFQTLDMLMVDESGRARLRDAQTVSRAVHLLQYLVDGSTNTPEPLLVLNKILCGVATSTPVEREIELTEREREICEQLLAAMIANWEIIKNTSIAGLRETFLQREGKLERSPDGWKLRVQRKTLDVLVDQISWSVSVVYNKWMPQPLYVNW